MTEIFSVPSLGEVGSVVIRTADVILTKKNSFNSGMSSCLKTEIDISVQ